jgi:hypothetical protein
MDIPNHAELLDRIETFCRRHDMAETRFGREAVSNPNFITGLRRDPPVSPTLKTLTEVQDFMARTDAEATTRAKLDASLGRPMDGPPREEVEQELPFVPAPGNPGATSATSSSTNAHRSSSEASPRCPSCSETDEDERAAEDKAA